MVKEARDKLVIHPLPAHSEEIGRALWMLEDARKRTYEAINDLDENRLDEQPPAGSHSAGTLLYHIAAIELDWLVSEVREGQIDESVWTKFPFDVRDANGRLTVVTGISLADHLERLTFTRRLLLDTYEAMSLADFRRVRSLERYDVTPEWVVHHLCQHEAEHRAELRALRKLD